MKVLKNGLSMVELLVAIAVLGGSLLPIWHMHYNSAKRVNTGRNQSIIKNLSLGFSAQVRKCSPEFLPATPGFLPIELDQNDTCHLGGPEQENNIVLPDWKDESLKMSYRIKKLMTLPRDNRLIILKITWTRANDRQFDFLVPTLVTK
ncbi:MAG: type II secretion system protein [Candidatus Rifleibacteriota bacterium]